jgi:FtsP/CotA-like multicopper oxidase with cupredoxin domain
MSTLLLALLSCSTDAPIRRFHVTATYGDVEIVGMAGTGLGALHGYHVDGQFGLPTLVAELGDTVEITLQNDTFEAMGLHPHGVRYDIDNDGISRLAAPGESVTYTWYATEGTGTFPYHSHEMDSAGYEYQAEAGILGALVVLDPKEPAPDAMVTYLMMAAYEPWTDAETGTPTVVEEQSPSGTLPAAARGPTGSGPLGPVASTPTLGPLSSDPSEDGCGGEGGPRIEPDDRDTEPGVPRDDGHASGTHDTSGTTDTSSAHGHGGSGGSTLGTHNHMLVVQTVSGAGWLQTDTRESNVSAAPAGASLRVNVVSFGTEFHTFHMHGYTWTDPGTDQVTDSVTVGPGTAYGFTIDALDNPGLWNIHCHVESHTHSMTAWMDVE